MSTELLGILKPDGTLRRAAGAGILQGLENSGLCKFLTFRKVNIPAELLDRHYHHVSQRDFYPWLVRYMSSGPSYVVCLRTEVQYVQKIRDLLGATRAQLAKPGTLRYEYAPYGGANCFHLSDSEDSAETEVPLWKEYFRIKEGDFDVNIDDYIAQYRDAPNNTQRIREICVAIQANGRPISHALSKELQDLVIDECLDAEPQDVQNLIWTIEEACFY